MARNYDSPTLRRIALPIVTPTTGAHTFSDVPSTSPFYPYIETAAHSIVSGYTCGGPSEPCDPTSRPYFRQNNDSTRSQIAKVVYLALTNSPACDS
jgi:hypothetical protein